LSFFDKSVRKVVHCGGAETCALTDKHDAIASVADAHRTLQHGLEDRLKLAGRQGKVVLKRLAAQYLPASIVERKKHGFAVPLARWFRGELAGFSRDVLLSRTCRERGIFDTRSVERLFALNARGRDLDLQLWTMLSFELWCRRFLDTREVRDVAPERTRQTLRRPPQPAIMAPAV